MKRTLTVPGMAWSILFAAGLARAQAPAAAPPPPPPPLWDAQIGASFVGTSGNSDTASTGADFSAHRRGEIWKIESAATLVRTSRDGQATAERYLGMLREQRALAPRVGLTSGLRLERDRFAGLDARSILDAGVSWALVHHPEWTLDGLTSVAWLHESRFTYDPDFRTTGRTGRKPRSRRRSP